MSHVSSMALGTPRMTFGELAREQLEIEVTCPNCNHRRRIDGDAPALRDRQVAGARFRCEQCGSVGLPSLGKQRLWPGKLADHARKLR
jgi:DNA-directed RNA polymerase subunit RPC12/RpoP